MSHFVLGMRIEPVRSLSALKGYSCQTGAVCVLPHTALILKGLLVQLCLTRPVAFHWSHTINLCSLFPAALFYQQAHRHEPCEEQFQQIYARWHFKIKVQLSDLHGIKCTQLWDSTTGIITLYIRGDKYSAVVQFHPEVKYVDHVLNLQASPAASLLQSSVNAGFDLGKLPH